MGTVEGWPAVAWVAGLGAGVILAASILWVRARALRESPAKPPTYRTVGTGGGNRASQVRGLALVLVAIGLLSQLLYVGLYVELARWLLGARERPHMEGDLFFWVFLVDITCAGASLFTGWRDSR